MPVALIEYIRVPLRDYAASPANDKPLWGPDHYAAFVLASNHPAYARLFDLGLADDIDALITAFRASIVEGQRPNRRNDIRRILESGAALRAFIFDPLIPAFRGRTRLLIAPR